MDPRFPLVLAFALGACAKSPERAALPSMVSVVCRLEPAGYISLLVDLYSPRRRPTLRVSPGFLSFDGDHLVDATLIPHLGASGGSIVDMQISDLFHPGHLSVRIAPPEANDGILEFIRFSGQTALVHGKGADWERWVEVDVISGKSNEASHEPEARRFVHFGPDRGFSVFLQEDDLVLKLPHDDETEAIPLLDGVAGIVSVTWIGTRLFPTPHEEVLDARFKMAGSMPAQARNCTLDGDLSEWSGDPAQGVGDLAQVQRGEQYWSGTRDASFAMATRLAPEALCMAIRVRDDVILAGEDTLEIQLSGRSWRLPIPEEPLRLAGPGWEAAFTRKVSFGVGVEIMVDGDQWEADDGIVPFRALYYDHDPDEGITELATAPDLHLPALAGIRLPRRAVEGAPLRWP